MPIGVGVGVGPGVGVDVGVGVGVGVDVLGMMFIMKLMPLVAAPSSSITLKVAV